jgi:hypothetical protein
MQIDWIYVFSSLTSDDNKHCFIICDLCRPAFTNIVSLVLRTFLSNSEKNQIVSIEALAFIQMDMLNFIDLGTCQIIKTIT